MEAVAKAWDRGQGVCPQMSLQARVAAVRRHAELLQPARERIVDALMSEICNSTKDAAAEFDRTMKFLNAVIESLEGERRY